MEQELTNANFLQENNFLSDICVIIDNGRRRAYAEVSSVMIETYWNIGKRIIEQEQKGKARADYGKKLINGLSKELTALYGEGFGTRTISYCRKCYLVFNDWSFLHTRVQNLYVVKSQIKLLEKPQISGAETFPISNSQFF